MTHHGAYISTPQLPRNNRKRCKALEPARGTKEHEQPPTRVTTVNHTCGGITRNAASSPHTTQRSHQFCTGKRSAPTSPAHPCTTTQPALKPVRTRHAVTTCACRPQETSCRYSPFAETCVRRRGTGSTKKNGASECTGVRSVGSKTVEKSKKILLNLPEFRRWRKYYRWYPLFAKESPMPPLRPPRPAARDSAGQTYNGGVDHEPSRGNAVWAKVVHHTHRGGLFHESG